MALFFCHPHKISDFMAHNVLLYATLRVADRATRNVGERRRGNEGAQRPTDLADANPGAPARARSAYNVLDDVLPSPTTSLFPIFF